MKKRYSIGFFAAFFLIISLLAIGYQLSYQYRMDKQEAKTVEEENTQFISTKGILSERTARICGGLFE